MAQVQLEVGGRRYDITCRDGEEERLIVLSRIVDSRASDVIRSLGRGNEPRELLMTALLLADELDEARTTLAAARLEEDARLTVLEHCAERLEVVAASLEMPEPSA